METLAHPTTESTGVAVEQTWNAPWMQAILEQLNDSGFRDDTHPSKRDIGRWFHPLNLFLKFTSDGVDAGFICFAYKGAGVLELHPCFLKEFRGDVTQKAGAIALDRAFLSTDCEQVTTFGLAQSMNWRHAAISAGFRELYRREWPNTVLGEKATMVHYGVTLDEWLTRSNERVADFPVSPEWVDPCARHLFPFFARMAQYQPLKAANLWNRHAAICNLATMTFYGKRGNGGIFSLGNFFFDLCSDSITPLGTFK